MGPEWGEAFLAEGEKKKKEKRGKKEENNLGIISISVDVSLDFGTTDAAKLGKKKTGVSDPKFYGRGRGWKALKRVATVRL